MEMLKHILTYSLFFLAIHTIHALSADMIYTPLPADKYRPISGNGTTNSPYKFNKDDEKKLAAKFHHSESADIHHKSDSEEIIEFFKRQKSKHPENSNRAMALEAKIHNLEINAYYDDIYKNADIHDELQRARDEGMDIPEELMPVHGETTAEYLERVSRDHPGILRKFADRQASATGEPED